MDGNGEAALTTLTAFLGAVIGFIGCLAGALISDLPFVVVAAIGGLICAGIWMYHLEPAR